MSIETLFRPPLGELVALPKDASGGGGAGAENRLAVYVTVRIEDIHRSLVAETIENIGPIAELPR